MNKRLLTILALLFFTIVTQSQNRLDKNEIRSFWTEGHNYQENPDNYKLGFDSIVSCKIDSLKRSGIDTIGAFQTDDVGAFTLDSCQCGIIPWTAYVQWVDKGLTYHQKFTKCCRFDPVQIPYSILILYYKNARKKIDKEQIMPVITEVKPDPKEKFILTLEIVDHSTDFTIYCDLNGQRRFTTFRYWDIDNENSLFHDENNNSAINSWRKIIEDQIIEIEK